MYYKNKIYSLKNYRSENYEELYVFLILTLKELLLENIKGEVYHIYGDSFTDAL